MKIFHDDIICNFVSIFLFGIAIQLNDEFIWRFENIYVVWVLGCPISIATITQMGRVAYIFYDALDQISRFWIPTDRCWIWMITGHPKKHSTKWIARRECMMHTNAIPTPMHLHILVLVCLACTLHNETHTHTSLLIHTSSLAVRTHSSTSRNAVRYNEGPYVCLTHAHTPCGANQRYHYGNSNFIVLHSDAHAFDGITVCFWVHNWWSANNKLIHQGE